MKRFLYILAAVAMLFVGGCAQGLNDITTAEGGNLPEVGEGEVLLSLDLKIKDAEVHSVNTRAVPSQENVTQITGYALVFGNDPATGTYGDNSPLLQKVAFKSIKGKVMVTMDEQEEPCFIRLMTTMTQKVRDEIDSFVSQKNIDEGTATGDVTLFKDYKLITVDLSGYYANVDKPATLTVNKAFPLASPGINMPEGLNEETVDALNKVIFMVPVAAKVDVTSKCNFTLSSVTLLNGAKEARMRSTVLGNDGTSVLETMPLPMNLGETVKYAEVAASGNTTANTPIYFYPNDGDLDTDQTREADEDLTPSDEINSKNPTYLIIKGTAFGYGEGFYKIPIRYEFNGKTTYDIVRNNHYKVNIKSVANAGYASFDEAVDGPANDIAYDITIGEGNTSAEDTFTDPRAETIVAHNGFFYVELVGSEIFAQGYGIAGVTGNIGLSLTSNQTAIDAGYTIPNLSVTPSSGITITSNASVSAGFAGTIGFTATQSGTITLRCGDMVKVIPVHYAATPHIYGSGSTIGGTALGAVSSLASDGDESYTSDASVINLAYGAVAANTTYKNREFRGKAYPSDMSKGIRKVYVVQASNFELNTSYDNTSAGGDKGTNNIFSTPTVSGLTSTYKAHLNYQSTGKIFQVNEETNGDVNYDKVMTTWKIGGVPITFTARGQFTTSNASSSKDSKNNLYINQGFIDYNWAGITDGSQIAISAINIKGNQPQGSNYDAKYAKIENKASVTLSNIAGEVKVYNFTLEQSAAPYIKDLSLQNGMYVWDCPYVADCSYSGRNYGTNKAQTPVVYNAHYKAGTDPYPTNDWSWSYSDNYSSGGTTYVGESEGKNVVSDGMSVVCSTDDEDAYSYYFKVNGHYKDYGIYVSSSEKVYQRPHVAYFDLRMTNDAGELVYLRIRLRRDDGR